MVAVAVAAVTSAFAASCGGTASTRRGSPSADGITLENVCERLPAAYCAQDEPCCMQAGFPFDPAFCQDRYASYCRLGVESVRAGRATFHPDKVGECVRSAQPFYDRCILSSSDWASLYAAYEPCGLVFAGTLAVGATCERQTDCAGATSYCDPDLGTCSAAGTAEIDQPCGNGCAPGLTCDFAQTVPVCAATPGGPVLHRDDCAPPTALEAPDGSVPGSDARVTSACERLVDVACAKLVECKVVTAGFTFDAARCSSIRAQSLASCAQSRASGIAAATDAEVDACVTGLTEFPCASLCGTVPQDPAACTRLGFEPESVAVTCAP